MPYLLLFVSLLFTSCSKKEQALSSNAFVSKAEQKSFISIPFSEGESKLRNKIIQKIIETKFAFKNPAEEIAPREEIGQDKLNTRELDLYLSQEKTSTKIVVSYTDKTEIYFVPKGILYTDLISQLGLRAEEGHIFKWFNVTVPKTYEGGVFYLISINHDDLMAFDRKNYSFIYNLEELNDVRSASLNGQMDIEVYIKYEYYRETLAHKEKQMDPSFCSGGLGCFCTYKVYAPSGNMNKVVPEVSWLALQFGINDSVKEMADFKYVNVSDSEIVFTISSDEVEREGAFNFRIFKNTPERPRHTSYCHDFNGTCNRNRCTGVDTTLATRTIMQSKIITKGRGEALKIIPL